MMNKIDHFSYAQYHINSLVSLFWTSKTSIPLSTSLQKLILCSSSDESNSFLSYGTGISQHLTVGFGKNESLTNLFIVREMFQNHLFPSLCSLEIQGWSKLKSLCGGGLEHLITLQELYLQDLDELEELDDHMPWRSLTNLRHLGLKNLPKLLSLPKGVQQITSLQSLSIDGCNQLASLPGALHNLVILDIRNCQGLKRCQEPVQKTSSRFHMSPNFHLSVIINWFTCRIITSFSNYQLQRRALLKRLNLQVRNSEEG